MTNGVRVASDCITGRPFGPTARQLIGRHDYNTADLEINVAGVGA